jgi:hypothetical protein
MSHTRFHAAALAAALITFSLAFVEHRAAAQETKPSDTDMAQEVKALREQVHELQNHQRDMEAQLKAQKEAANQPTAEQVNAAVERVREDARLHSQVLETGGAAAGYNPDTGFFIRADDGRFLLHPWSLFQFRDVSTVLQGADSGDNNNVQNGFELRRVQLGVDGTMFTPDFTYRVFIQNVRTTGDIELVMAMARYHFPGTPWSVLGGQFKSPLDHEPWGSLPPTWAAIRRTTPRTVTRMTTAFACRPATCSPRTSRALAGTITFTSPPRRSRRARTTPSTSSPPA